MSEYSLSPQLGAAPANLGQRLDYVRGFLFRQYLPILLCLAIALPIGAFYALTSPKTYAASAIMMIETRKGPLDGANAPPRDVAWFETHLLNLKSMNVLGFVVKQLNLADDALFLHSEASRLERTLSRIGWSASLPTSDALRTRIHPQASAEALSEPKRHNILLERESVLSSTTTDHLKK